jgi:hypothetical protein
MKIVGYIAAAILIFFGVIFIWGAFGANGNFGWILVGIISVAIGMGIILLIQRKAKQEAATNVTLKIDLPANVAMDAMKCKSCGGTLSAENIKMTNGAPVVTCPYCKSVYQLTEEPKW